MSWRNAARVRGGDPLSGLPRLGRRVMLAIMTTVNQAISAGYQLHAAGQPDQAAAVYRRVLAVDADNAAAHHLLGLALADLDDLPGAAEQIALAVRADPTNASFHTNLGTIHKALNRPDLAERSYRRALALDPGGLDALASLGGVLQAGGRLAAAEQCLRRAYALNPDHAVTLVNLGVVLTDRGVLPQAQALLRRAADLSDPASDVGAEARWDLALALLTAGDYVQGWPQFEWRRHRPGFPLGGPQGPEWDGGDPHRQTILVHTEQGRGDSVQFARFLPLLAARGARVVLACQPELRRLLARVRGVADTVSIFDPPPPFHAHVPLLSLPYRLGQGAVPAAPPPPVASPPYLLADPAAVAAWTARLDAAAPGRMRVGLCWAGAGGNPIDARRSLDPALLAPLAAGAAELGGLAGRIALVSLQKGPAAAGGAALPGLIDWTDELHDYDDTAALVAALDLVISVDTSVAHIAGALGRPVWLLNRYDGCWRWGKGTPDSPWYPTLRQFRQRDPGDWSVPLAQAAAWLRQPARWTVAAA